MGCIQQENGVQMGADGYQVGRAFGPSLGHAWLGLAWPDHLDQNGVVLISDMWACIWAYARGFTKEAAGVCLAWGLGSLL